MLFEIFFKKSYICNTFLKIKILSPWEGEMVEGFACYAKKFGLSPVGNRELRKVSKQGWDMLSV